MSVSYDKTLLNAVVVYFLCTCSSIHTKHSHTHRLYTPCTHSLYDAHKYTAPHSPRTHMPRIHIRCTRTHCISQLDTRQVTRLYYTLATRAYTYLSIFSFSTKPLSDLGQQWPRFGGEKKNLKRADNYLRKILICTNFFVTVDLTGRRVYGCVDFTFWNSTYVEMGS